MQKTLTVKGKRFTGKQIANMFDHKMMTYGQDYIVYLNSKKFYGVYRQIQDQHFAPVCNRKDANAISLMPDDGSFHYSIWLEL